jgi:5-hydroxyisourate hydrolase
MAGPGKLTTHVLDVSAGRPAAGMRIECYRVLPDGVALISNTVTNEDGRTPGPLLTGEAMTAATYRILFYVGEFYASANHPHARRFLDVVPIQFVVDDDKANYHVPMLVSPWSYSTYRGS